MPICGWSCQVFVPKLLPWCSTAKELQYGVNFFAQNFCFRLTVSFTKTTFIPLIENNFKVVESCPDDIEFDDFFVIMKPLLILSIVMGM
jgi:hypothetical protein